MSTAIKNPREGTRSPRTGHELKRTYEMMDGTRGHPGREAAPFEGNEASTQGCFSNDIPEVHFVSYFFLFSPGLISRALPRDGSHPDSKERPILAGSIMQGWLRERYIFFVFHRIKKKN